MKKQNSYMSNFSLKLYNVCQRHPFFRKTKIILYYIDWLLLLFVKKPKKVDSKRKKVFIMYNYAFGDGIIFLCSFKHIRKIYDKKNYEITIICQKGLQSIYENVSVFDKVIPYDLTKSTFNLKKRFNLFKLLRNNYYDIVLDPIGANECTTNVFMSRALCADKKITMVDLSNGKTLCPKWLYNKIYDKVYINTKVNLSLISYYGEFIKNLGLKEFNVKLEHFDSPKLKIDLPKEYYIIFPSASTKLKRWPIENYAEIIKRIYDKTGKTLLFCGTTSDSESIEELKKLIEGVPYVDIVNKTSLMEFISVIKEAQFVVTNDTSTYHIAVTNEIPVTIITGGYTYSKYVLYNFKESNRYKKPYIVTKKMECFDCDNKCCKLKSEDRLWPCLEAVTIEDAWKIINKMIDETREEDGIKHKRKNK